MRAAAAVVIVGLLVTWLVRPIGDPCPELGQLPPGATASSAPSLTPPLTRTCTYRTLEGAVVRTRYVPVVEVLALVVAGGAVGLAIALFGAGSPRRRASAERRRPG